MKTIAMLTLFCALLGAQTVTVNYPSNMLQTNDSSTPWAGTYADCGQTIAIQYSGLYMKTWGARCVGANPPSNTDFYFDVSEYVPFVLLGSGYDAVPWQSWFNYGWEFSFPNLSNGYSTFAATHHGTTSILNPSGVYHETIDDYRWQVPAWSSTLSGLTFTMQFIGLHGAEGTWSYSSGVSIVYS